jgi:hypothetical protein
VGTHGSFGAALSREAGAVVLSLYVGVPGPQGTDGGLRAHVGRGCEPTGGANILSPRSLSESLCAGIPKRWCSTADVWRPVIHADIAMLMEPSRVTVPRGPLQDARRFLNHRDSAHTGCTGILFQRRRSTFSSSSAD